MKIIVYIHGNYVFVAFLFKLFIETIKSMFIYHNGKMNEFIV